MDNTTNSKVPDYGVSATPEEVVGWNIPGWDWKDGDYSWLSSESGINSDGTSIFFIRGGMIKHQSHIPEGYFTIPNLIALITSLAEGLSDVTVAYDADEGLWVEGVRPPNQSDIARLSKARARQEHADRISYMMIRKVHPEWFTPGVRLDQHGRPL